MELKTQTPPVVLADRLPGAGVCGVCKGQVQVTNGLHVFIEGTGVALGAGVGFPTAGAVGGAIVVALLDKNAGNTSVQNVVQVAGAFMDPEGSK